MLKYNRTQIAHFVEIRFNLCQFAGRSLYYRYLSPSFVKRSETCGNPKYNSFAESVRIQT